MESRRRVLWGSALLLAAATPLFGAPIDFERISLREGLSQSVIQAIVQDRKGFLWFGTEDGLNRFDGYRFTVYRYQADNPRSLIYNEIKSLHEDRAGVIWIGTFEGGLSRFDPAIGTFTGFRHDPSNRASLAANTVRCLFEDRGGNLWIGTQGGGSTGSTVRPESSAITGTIPWTPRAFRTTMCGRFTKTGRGFSGSEPTVGGSPATTGKRGASLASAPTWPTRAA